MQDIITKIDSATSLDELEQIRLELFGKKGSITAEFTRLKDVEPENKKAYAQSLNIKRDTLTAKLNEKKAVLESEYIKAKMKSEAIDISLFNEPLSTGALHPVMETMDKIIEYFVAQNFSIETGPLIEDDFHNFEALNLPKYHPARDMQDTFWLDNGQLLKTQTSAAQNRILRKYNGALKAIFPGRCFRNEALDHSHENTFFQIEGMLVDKEVSVANLIYFMKKMLSEVFKTDINIRLRPGFFPFVEPGFEMDATCTFCGGKGCPTCKNSGWLELCPCGMIHPNVLKLADIDPNEYSGFAFGLGFDRLVMLKTGLDDIRHLNSGNLKVLNQFGVKA